MSDDLISRSWLLEQYGLKDCTKYGNETAEQKKKSYDTMMMYEIAEMIKDAPTIYYLDKIIERLKELKTYNLNMADAMLEIMRRDELGTYVCLEDVIEIVKYGGAADE